MSGGAFDYRQYQLECIADDIEKLVENNDKKDDWGYSRNYPEEVLEKFREAVKFLRITETMVQRIDWLVSGDDGEDSFLKRWAEEVENKYEKI